MRTPWNVAVQIVALVCLMVLRLNAPGWLLAIFVISLIGPMLLIVPIVAALATLSRRRLTWPVQLPFLTAAVTMVVAAAFIEEGGDQGGWIPVVELFWPGHELADGTTQMLNTLGHHAGMAFVAAVVWLLVALGFTAIRPRAVRPVA